MRVYIEKSKDCDDPPQELHDTPKVCVNIPEASDDALKDCNDNSKTCDDTLKDCDDDPKTCDNTLKDCDDNPKTCDDTKKNYHYNPEKCNTINVSPIIMNNITVPSGTYPPTLPAPISPFQDLNFCVPLVQGYKPKQSIEHKLINLAKNNEIATVLGGYYFYLVRRYLSGSSPTNAIEEDAFTIFSNLSAQNKELLKCTMENFEKTPPDLKNRLLSEKIERNAPITEDKLIQFVAEELIQRIGETIGMDSGRLLNQHAGLPRPQLGSDNQPLLLVRIYSINNLRTNEHIPSLNILDYKKEELDLQCTAEGCGPKIETPDNPCLCNYKTTELPLFDINYCLRVLEFLPGEAVILKGVNFIDTNAKVHIKPAFSTPDPIIYIVDAKVCGDTNTPIKEVIDGQEHVIRDSRVKDTLIFTIPNRIPEGSYKFKVIFQNDTGIGLTNQIQSNIQYLRVIPPVDTTFNITFKQLDVVQETQTQILWWSTDAGSDEPSITTIAIPIDFDLTPSEGKIETVKYDDADSGDSYTVNKELFKRNRIQGLSLAIIGYEVNNEDSYKEQVNSYIDSIIRVVSGVWDKIAKRVASAAIAEIEIPIGALPSITSNSISLVVMGAIITSVAFWAPADLIIEDTINMTFKDFADLTNPNIPFSKVQAYWTRGNPNFNMPSKIDSNVYVEVLPISKSETEYIEIRKYFSLLEDSEYDITLSYTSV